MVVAVTAAELPVLQHCHCELAVAIQPDLQPGHWLMDCWAEHLANMPSSLCDYSEGGGANNSSLGGGTTCTLQDMQHCHP